jgi:hypothetical protein
MGYVPDELIGQKVHFLSSPERRKYVDTNIKRILSGEVLHFVEESVKKDGSTCYIQLNEQRIVLPNGKPGIISIAQDMTKQVLAEKALNRQLFINEVVSAKYLNMIIPDGKPLTFELSFKAVENGFSINSIIKNNDRVSSKVKMKVSIV